MRVKVEVQRRTLYIRGSLYAVGERLWLDTDNPAHREVLAADGWVRRVEEAERTGLVMEPAPSPCVGEPVVTAALTGPPADRMMTGAPVAKRSGRPDNSRGRQRGL